MINSVADTVFAVLASTTSTVVWGGRCLRLLHHSAKPVMLMSYLGILLATDSFDCVMTRLLRLTLSTGTTSTDSIRFIHIEARASGVGVAEPFLSISEILRPSSL